MATALLFDRDRVDEVDDWTDSLPKVGRSAILWIDLEEPSEDDVAHLVDAFDLEASHRGGSPAQADGAAARRSRRLSARDGDRPLRRARDGQSRLPRLGAVARHASRQARRGRGSLPGARGGFGNGRDARRPRLPGEPPRVGAVELPRCLRGARAGPRGDRRQGDVGRGVGQRRGARGARRDAAGGGTPPPRARLASRGRARADAPGARGDRELRLGRALLLATRSARGGRAGRRATRASRSSARSTCSSRARGSARTRS